MDDRVLLEQLVDTWRRQWLASAETTPEAICRERPDLIEPLKREIEQIKLIDELKAHWEELVEGGSRPTPEEVCREHPLLLERFKSELLRLHRFDGAFDATDAGATDAGPTGETGVGEFCGGRYAIRDVLNRGGQGIIYTARDCELDRVVVVKGPGRMAALGDGLARLEQEARTTGRLEHPGIVPVYGFGHDRVGRPYWAMKYIDGETLGDAIARFHAGARANREPGARTVEFQKLLRDFVVVCRTIAYAHNGGFVHRDIKPINIMLGKFGEVWVMDWGLAKQTGVETSPDGKTTPHMNGGSAAPPHSEPGSIKGTWVYMSPEQAEGRDGEIGTASDVYSLGATLYELLAGQRPIAGSTLAEVQRNVKAGRIVPPRQVNAGVAAPLEAVCLKAMSFRPADRYEGAGALADDLERWLADEPVGAWREPFGLRARRWLRRHRTLVTGSVAALLVALVGVGLLAGQQSWARSQLDVKNKQLDGKNTALLAANRREKLAAEDARGQKTVAETQRTEAELQRGIAQNLAEKERQARNELEERLYFDRIALADREWQANNLQLSAHLLEGLRPTEGRRDLRNFEWHYLARRNQSGGGMTLSAHADGLTALDVSSRGLIVTGGRDGTVTVWIPGEDAGRLEPRGLPRRHVRQVACLVFSRDGAQLISTAKPPAFEETRAGDALLWNLADVRTPLELPYANINGADFDPEGKRLALACEDGRVRIWDLAERKELHALRLHDEDDAGRAACVAFSPDGKRLVAGGWYGDVRVWNADTGESLLANRKHHFTTEAVAFHPDGKRIASIGWNMAAALWDAETGQDVRFFWGHTENPASLAFSADGERLVTAGGDRTLRVWDVENGEQLRVLRGHRAPLAAVTFFKEGPIFLAGDIGGEARLWSTGEEQDARVLRGHPAHVFDAAFSRDGRIASTGSDFRDRAVRIWDARSGERLITCEGHEMIPNQVSFSADDKLVASVSESFAQIPDRKGKVLVWNSGTGEIVHTLGEEHGGGTSLAFSRDNRLLAWGDPSQRVHVYDLDRREELHLLEGHLGVVTLLAFTPEGDCLAVSRDGASIEVKVWNPQTGEAVATHVKLRPQLYGVAFDADCKRLALAGGEAGGETIDVWNLERGEFEATITGHAGKLGAVAFSPDGTRLASASENGTTLLWDLASRKEILALRHNGIPYRLVFNPQGEMLAVVGGPLVQPGEVRIWDARPLPP